MRNTAAVRQIVGQGASVAATRVTLIAASFVSSIIVARALPLEERGLFGLVLASATLAVQLGNFGLPVANTYLIASQRELSSELIGNTVRLFFAAVVAMAVLALGLRGSAPDWPVLQGWIGPVAWLIAAAALAQLFVQNMLMGKLQFGVNNGLELLARLGAIAGMGVLWWAGATTTLAFGLAVAVASLCAAAWGFRRGRLRLVLDRWDAPTAREQWRYGARAYIACVASFALARVPLYVTELRSGLEGTAYFTQALVLADTMLVLPVAFGTVLFPNLAGMDEPAGRSRATWVMIGGVAAMMGAGSFVVALLAPWVLPLLYGAPYESSVPLLHIMLPGVVALGIASVTQNSLSANGYPWSSVAAPLTGLAVACAAVFIRQDVAGCAWAYTAGAVAMLLTSAVCWWRSQSRWSERPPAARQDPR